jgi:hypothetical protein
MNEVEPVADNNERKLVRELRLLEEVLNFLGIVKIALSANALNFPNLTSASCGLDILKVDFLVLAEVDDGAKVVVETCFKCE